MLYYIYGGVASGKSEFAENFISQNFDNKIYLATMENTTSAKKRIDKHLLQRAGKGFTTVEEAVDLGNIKVYGNSNILLEDLTNLLANNIFDKNGLNPYYKQITEKVFSDIIALENRCNSLFIVGNDVFFGDYISDETDIFLDSLYYLHNRIISIADRVTEVIYGIPYHRKIK